MAQIVCLLQVNENYFYKHIGKFGISETHFKKIRRRFPFLKISDINSTWINNTKIAHVRSTFNPEQLKYHYHSAP